MATRYGSDPRDRAWGAAAALIVQAAIGYVLITGLAASFPHAVSEGLKLFEVAPPPRPPEPPPPVPPQVRTDRPEGRASPPNLRNKATEVVAPPPVIPLVVPPPVIVADKAGVGAARNTGAADIPGPGTGAGGVGDGTGSGGAGDGDGGGGGVAYPPEWISGEMSNDDDPRGDKTYRRVIITGTIGIDGRLHNCEVAEPSGDPRVDETTCRLLTERRRFRPARNRLGRPIPYDIEESHEWGIPR